MLLETDFTLHIRGLSRPRARCGGSLIPALEQRDLWEFGSSLVYLESSRPAKTTKYNPVSQGVGEMAWRLRILSALSEDWSFG